MYAILFTIDNMRLLIQDN